MNMGDSGNLFSLTYSTLQMGGTKILDIYFVIKRKELLNNLESVFRRKQILKTPEPYPYSQKLMVKFLFTRERRT